MGLCQGLTTDQPAQAEHDPCRFWLSHIHLKQHKRESHDLNSSPFHHLCVKFDHVNRKSMWPALRKKTVDSSKQSSQSQVLHVSFRSVWRVQQVQEVGIGWSKDFYHEKGCD